MVRFGVVGLKAWAGSMCRRFQGWIGRSWWRWQIWIWIMRGRWEKNGMRVPGRLPGYDRVRGSDAVVIATPHIIHAPMGLDCLEAGCILL